MLRGMRKLIDVEDFHERLYHARLGTVAQGGILKHQRCRGIKQMRFPRERIEDDRIIVQLSQPHVRSEGVTA